MVDFVGSNLNRSISDDGSYVQAVREALSNYSAFQKFKRDPRYTAVLEHTTKYQGMLYLDILKSQSPELLARIDEFKVNDLEGGAVTEVYELVGEFSPSTLRYIKVSSDICNIFGRSAYNRIAEIGVGYGGQLLVNDRALLFKEYHLFDLQPVLDLTSKYLECHLLNGSYMGYTLNRHDGNQDYDLAISNYAFSELPSKIQIKYVEKILSRSRRGYLTMNSGLPHSAFKEDKLSIVQLGDMLPRFEVLDENPLTYPGNFVIVWGHRD